MEDENQYEHLTNEDVMSGEELAEYDRDAELRFDAAQEAENLRKWQDQNADLENSADYGGCDGEFIDGTWNGCGNCPECEDQCADDVDDEEVYA